MPREAHLLNRKGYFHFNMRIPKDLRASYGGKEFLRFSLDTLDRREAISRARFHAFKFDSDFKAKRLEKKTNQPPPRLTALDEIEAHQIVVRWLIEQEKLSEEWKVETVANMDEQEKEELAHDLRVDAAVYGGGGKHYRGEDASDDLDAFLAASGLDCPKDSPAYRKLLSLFTKAKLENILRNIDRLTGHEVKGVARQFQDVFAHTSVTLPARVDSVGEMVDRYLRTMKDSERSGGTLRTYEVPCRLLREFLGEILRFRPQTCL